MGGEAMSTKEELRMERIALLLRTIVANQEGQIRLARYQARLLWSKVPHNEPFEG